MLLLSMIKLCSIFVKNIFRLKKKTNNQITKKIKLYDLAKTTESWKNSNLDINAKQYILRKVNNNWTSFHKALKSF